MLEKPTALDIVVHIFLTIVAFSSAGVIGGLLYLFLGYIISYLVASFVGMACGIVLMILARIVGWLQK